MGIVTAGTASGLETIAFGALLEPCTREARHMAVYRLFKNEPFEPEAIVSMTRVYTDVCQTLGLSDTDHHETNVVAEKVIEFAQRGARDPMLLRDCVLEALRG
jgi:hypothetical protein